MKTNRTIHELIPEKQDPPEMGLIQARVPKSVLNAVKKQIKQEGTTIQAVVTASLMKYLEEAH